MLEESSIILRDDEVCYGDNNATVWILDTTQLKEVISCHWLTFPMPSSTEYNVMGALYGFIFAIGFPANLLVLIIWARSKILTQSYNSLIASLTLADLIMLCKNPIAVVNNFHHGPFMDYGYCQAYGFVSVLSGMAAIWSLTAIAFQRYKVISAGINGQTKHWSHAHVWIIISIIWSVSLAWAVIPLLGLGTAYTYEGLLTTCTVDTLGDTYVGFIYVNCMGFMAWIIPLAIIAFGNYRIYVANKRNNDELQKIFPLECRREISSTGMTNTSETGSDSPDNGNGIPMMVFKQGHGELTKKISNSFQVWKFIEQKKKTEIRLAKTTFSLVILWILSWTPYAIVFLTACFFPASRKYITPMVSALPAIFCKVSAAVNPFVYGLWMPKYKIELHRFIKKVKSCASM